MYHLNEAIDDFVKSGIVSHIAVRVGRGDDILHDTFRGGSSSEFNQNPHQ